MNFKQCAICGLNVPIFMAKPIVINNKGELIRVTICSLCEVKKMKEAKERGEK